MSLLENIKKGWKYMAMGFEQSDLTVDRIAKLVSDWEKSSERHWMLAGEKYYRVDNDYVDENTGYSDSHKADNRLIHAKYKNLVDEKIGFKLSKEAVLNSEDDKYASAVKATLGKYFNYRLESLGYQASNKGIAWLHPYIEDGQLKLFVVPSEQCIPVWADASHESLVGFIRVYSFKVWRFGREVEMKRVEVWDENGVRFFRKDGGVLLSESDLDRAGHFLVDGQPASWGRIPFVAFKNNRYEIPDLKVVKTHNDNYDRSRSETANYIQETKNVVYVLKGYGGTSAADFVASINRDRALVLDDDDVSGVSTLTPAMDITATKEHYEQLSRDIIESGQGVDRSFDKFSNAPSGIALRFLFSGLELKCNALESEFRKGFDYLMNFVNHFLAINGSGIKPADIDIIFSDNVSVDTESVIKQASDSLGIISQKTIVANHPWVKDINAELEQLKLEQEDDLANYRPAPIVEEDDEEDTT